jgi:chromosome segregation ATPase
MKGDNLMYQEDIKRLSEMNKHLEDQIKEERNRNLELANNNENLLQENIQYKKDIQNLCNEVKNNKISNNTFEETFRQKNEAESKIKELLYNLNQLKDEKDKFEADNRIIVERYNELEKEYDKLKCDYCLIKKNNECQMSMIENKINTFSYEIGNLQKENSNLRQNEEKLRVDYSNLLEQKNDINNLYTEQKNKNELLNMQIQNIQKDFEKLLKEKEMQDLLREKYLEEQRLKNESKAKLVNDLQNRIQNYRTERLKKKE